MQRAEAAKAVRRNKGVGNVKQLKKLAGECGYYPMGLTVAKNRLHASVVSAGETCSLVIFEKGKDEPAAVFAMDPAQRQGNV